MGYKIMSVNMNTIHDLAVRTRLLVRWVVRVIRIHKRELLLVFVACSS